MPGYDRTGPQGRGAMTGGGFGYCNPNVRYRRPRRGMQLMADPRWEGSPIYPIYGWGRGGLPWGCSRGWGPGDGRGRGRGRW
jgi:hypothetical protein